MDYPLSQIQENYPAAWAKWSAYAMKIPFQDLKKQDWFKPFFNELGIEYANWAVDSSFKTLELRLTQAN